MKKLIAIFSIILICGGLVAGDFYWNNVTITGVASTTTDTIGPYQVNGYDWVAVHTALDLETSTTITMTLTPMARFGDATYKDLQAAQTVASAVTADDDDLVTVLRGGDSTISMPTPVFWLKRVVTVTGDSVTVRQNIFAK